ncbi:MAG TPA: protein kinase [Gaiellaceae bacterium]
MRTELLRGRYEPLEVVGRGGEGEVVRALDHLHGRDVALKVRTVADDASRTHLLSEARLLLSLSPHPGLPLVREDFFVDDRYVIAMDWIEGMDLEALLELEGRPGLDPALAIDYLGQAAEALAHLHGHDPPVVHGDVKPANLVLTSSGRIVVVDFGLSSTPADDLRRAGTAGYVAPEVAAGARPTPASDVFSFAATALTLLTGEPPDGAPSWGEIERERIPALERIVRANLATDPQRRDASAPALAARLGRWWGAALPTGTVTLLLTDGAEASVDEVARAHGGYCVAPADDGPVLAAFASAQDGVDAARELASHPGARVAAVTVEAEPYAGSYREATAARLLNATAPGQLLVDNATAGRVDSELPPEIGLAELSVGWALVAPGLSIPPRAANCPYRGLIAFGSEDDDLFFGREEVVASILDQLLDGGFMAVVGASGSGKSSLVRAGLVPAYRRARGGRVVVVTPGSGTWPRDVGSGPDLLIVDQFEEVFTLWSDESLRTAFLDDLMDSPAAVVIALRADFYGRCAEHPRLAAAVAEHQHLLGPMHSDELRRAIEGPARSGGLRFEAGLVDAMLADVEGEPGALPLLSHALYESWIRRDGRVLTTAGYRAAGGVRGAIAQSAEAVFLACSPDEQALMRRMFLRLTELGEATEDTRRRVPLSDLVPGMLLEQLTAARLLVVSDDSAEIAHEALIREWPRLRGWLAEDREALRTLRQLTMAARSWNETGRNDTDLYRGPRLAAALELPGDLSRAEREFLDASHSAQTRELMEARRRGRRLRVLLAAVAVALVAALIAGSFALVQRGRATHSATVAQAGRLAAQSREVAAKHPDLGLLLALEGDRLDDSVDTLGALLGALEHGSRIHTWLQGFDAPVEATAFSPDGKLMATATQKGTTLWNTATWRPDGPPLRSSQGGWDWVDFSPDGRTLAIAGAKGRVELWDVATKKKVRDLKDPAAATSHEPALAFVSYSPDGRLIAAGAQESNHVTLWDAASGRPIGRPLTVKPPGGGAQWVSFSPDSKWIVAPGAPGTVGIWDVATRRRIGAPIAIGSAGVNAAIFAEAGRTLITSDDDGSISFVDIRTGRSIRQPLSVGSEGAGWLDLSPDGRLLAAGSFEGPVFVWDAKTGEPYGKPLPADTSPGNDVEFSPDGRTLASSHLRSAIVWNMDGVQAIGRPLGGPADLTTDVAFSHDGRWLAAGGFDGDTTVYHAATRHQAYRIAGPSIVTAVAFDADGKYLAVGTIDGVVQLFDAQSGAVVGRPLDVGPGAVWQLAFSSGARLLAIAVDRNGEKGFNLQRRQGEVQLWDVDTSSRVGQAIRPGAGSVLSLAFNADGTMLATGSYEHRLDLWDVATQKRHGKPMRVFDDAVPSVAFDPSGELVAGGGANGPVHVWRVADQRPAFPPLTGHIGPVTGTAFDPAGSFLATTTLFGATRLWDAVTGLGYGDELAASPRPSAVLSSMEFPQFLGLRNAFSPDGKVLAVSGVETLAMLWDADPAVWRRRACAIAGRNLTREQWKLYLPAGTPYRKTCSQWPSG